MVLLRIFKNTIVSSLKLEARLFYLPCFFFDLFFLSNLLFNPVLLL